jgi:secreted trypsin-like serine protease
MRFDRKILALAAVIAALAALVASAPAGAAGRHGGAHASVIGGTTVKIEEYPWLAYIEGGLDSGSFSFSCTGTVIAPRVVLTAGHCTLDLEAEVLNRPDGYLVATGVASHRHVPADHISHVSRVLLYPGFNPTFIHGDAGLLILSQPVAAPAIALAGAGDTGLLAAGTPMEIAGWGLTNFRRETEPALPQAGKLTVQDTARCRTGDTDLHRHFSPALQLCALDTPDFRTSGCFGDSGGPAIAHRTDGTPVEIGIVSSGGFECEPRVPNLYTRVDKISTWAYEWVAAVETGAPEPPVPPLSAPRMHALEAKILARRGLGEDFATKGQRRGDLEESIAATCTRTTGSGYRCRVHWRHGDARFYGTITVFFTPHTGPVTWNDGYTIHRVSESCLRRSSRCPVKTRSRQPGTPKRV